MFYSHLVLAKKGPLGKIWLAGHFSQHKRLSKQQIFQTNITLSVGMSAMQPYTCVHAQECARAYAFGVGLRKKLSDHVCNAFIDHILNPSAPYALRMSGHLMLGVVRIYSKKVEYLVTDCQAAMYKAKAV
jgi:cohesin complex subunit SCC1